jgi:hypothetical protein
MTPPAPLLSPLKMRQPQAKKIRPAATRRVLGQGPAFEGTNGIVYVLPESQTNSQKVDATDPGQ